MNYLATYSTVQLTRIIHKKKNFLALTDDEYQAIIESNSKEKTSCKDCTRQELYKIAQVFIDLVRNTNKKQKSKCYALWCECHKLQLVSSDYYTSMKAFYKKMFKADFDEASKVDLTKFIGMLKKIIENSNKKE